MVRVLINGAGGRMGRRLIALAAEDRELAVAGAFERPDHPDLGKDAGALAGVPPLGVALSARCDVAADVAIDFSHADSALEMIAWCAARGLAVVVGTTGLGAEGHKRLDAAATRIPCLLAPNMSLGVNVLLRLVREAAAALGDAYDVEIVEAHHNKKKDAPSGTALALGEAAAAGLKRNLPDVAVHGRHGMVGERTVKEIGFHAVRAGDIVGDHTVIFGGQGERVEVRHIATSRDTFARGALRAAKFLAGKPPGRYAMADVLGLK
ncbi:MAG TPA: 4-hydroxy-tetrahydrodipicolinate reductase [Planctomycetota bacterium]|nr:4-hydroxy-tetrahydrodipicolinate reductase [Planctomycetota bacterium]HRR82567.1 4-hydroxy-tetrahydrodipicolinate reductase [Planctomycetota bacterium]HRT95396.1 4-hydroxy-tetrahydrodipicolinate reductase [Planctomycetota bacterium]